MTSKLSWVQTRRSNLEVGGNGRFYSFNSLGGRKAGKKQWAFPFIAAQCTTTIQSYFGAFILIAVLNGR